MSARVIAERILGNQSLRTVEVIGPEGQADGSLIEQQVVGMGHFGKVDDAVELAGRFTIEPNHDRYWAAGDRGVGGREGDKAIPELIERGRNGIKIFFERLEKQLSNSAFIAGDFYSMADITGLVETS